MLPQSESSGGLVLQRGHCVLIPGEDHSEEKAIICIYFLCFLLRAGWEEACRTTVECHQIKREKRNQRVVERPASVYE